MSEETEPQAAIPTTNDEEMSAAPIEASASAQEHEPGDPTGAEPQDRAHAAPKRPRRRRTEDAPTGDGHVGTEEREEDEQHAISAEAEALVAEFAATQPFPLDPFQAVASAHLASGHSVLVAAPTGTGKTVVAEFAIWLARRTGQRAIYTAPIKALSNQKYRDLRARHGEREVGLLTGDIVENPAAPILVMTTEIYRNMLLEGSRVAAQTLTDQTDELLRPVQRRKAAHALRDEQGGHGGHGRALPANLPDAADPAALARSARLDEELSGVGCVVFDELHFLSDPERGPVWEEAIIHSPAHVLFAGLSATVSNADELRRWIERVHGPTALVFHDERAVPLEHFFFLDDALHLVQNAAGERVEHFPNVGGEAKIARARARGRRFRFGSLDDEEAPPTRSGARSRGSGSVAERRTDATTPGSEPSATTSEPEQPKERPAPEPGEVLTALRKADLLPSLYFLPGRRAVETAAASAAGHLLVSPEQRARLHAEVQQWVAALPKDDQRLDQVQRLASLLPRGLGFHHAGLLPGLKLMVETLFARGELRAVFATDTLALGINMPARSVVIGSMSKFDGTQMRLLTPNEYQQLTGRAGRRGKDAYGAAILLYSPWDAFEPSFELLTAPLLPVTSTFTVRYNTVLNLWEPGDLSRLRRAVANSLREFQRKEYLHARRRGGAAREERRQAREQRPQNLSRAAAAELGAAIYVLKQLGYIDQQDELSVRGHLLRAIFHPAGMILVELLMAGAFDYLSPAEVAEVCSWFTYDSSDRALRNLFTLPQRLQETRREVWKAMRLVQSLEYQEGVEVSPGIVDSFHSVALNWSRGMTLGGLLRRIELAEGDLLVSLNQTIDLVQQLQGAVGQTLDSRWLWRLAGSGSRYGRFLGEAHERLEALRPTLAQAWQEMLRGSVALSRAVPSMAAPTPEEPDIPPLPNAEDEGPAEMRDDHMEDVGDIVDADRQ